MHEQLHSDAQIALFLTVEDDELLRLEIIATDETLDLSVVDEVVVAMDGEALKVEVEDRAHVSAVLGSAEDLEERAFSVLVRVYEFFEGWDFGPDLD